MPLFFTFIFLSYDTLQEITSHNFYMMWQAFMSEAAGGIITSHSFDEVGAG
jgi:hypothetical protein